MKPAHKLIRIETKVGESPYLVIVGTGAKDLLAETIKELSNPLPGKVAIVTDENISCEVDPGLEHKIFRIPEGEVHKNLSTVEKLCCDFSDYGLTRGDLVVAMGGGLISDTVGFAASVYHRGLPVLFVPTTLLAQVDAAIGGKTGVNLSRGKNLMGTFHQPLAVLCDTQVLDTLPEREYLSGMGEVAKYYFIADALKGLGDYLTKIGLEFPDGGLSTEMPLTEKIALCIGIKLFVVTQDEKDTGLRGLLNYGHTLGHALEVLGDFDLRHGEAVAIGVIFAAELAHILGRIDEERVAHHRKILESYSLPIQLTSEYLDIAEKNRTAELMDLMRRDKKARGEITFVLEGPDGMDPMVKVPKESVVEALAKIRKDG